MIVKKMRQSKDYTKTSQQHGKDLINYILTARTIDKSEEKLLYSGAINMIFDDTSDVNAVIAEQNALASFAARSKNPFNHYMISVPAHENVRLDEATCKKIVEKFMQELEISNLSAVYGVHDNTSHRHIHICVNRVNPETEKVVKIQRGFDINAAHAAVAKISHDLEFEKLKNAKFIVENGLVKKNPAYQKGISDQSREQERTTGQESDERICRSMKETILQAKSWQELHAALAVHGVKYIKQKNGGGKLKRGKFFMKASDVHRECSPHYLEQRLGAYEPAKRQHIEQQERREKMKRLWTDRNIDHVKREDIVALVVSIIVRKLVELLFGIKENYNAKRKEVESLGWKGKGKELNALRSAMSVEYKEEKSELRKKYIDICKKCRTAQLEVLIETVKQYGSEDEKKFITAYERDNLKVMSTDYEIARLVELEKTMRSTTDALQADTYKVNLKATENEGKTTLESTVFAAEGKIYNLTAEDMRLYQPEILEKNVEGYGVMIQPKSEKFYYILLDDISNGSIEQMQKDGVKPALIFSTSENSKQAIIRVNKISNSETEKSAVIKLSRIYAEKYECDLSAVGAVKNFRMPGTLNLKHKYSDNPPRCQLLHSENVSCDLSQKQLTKLELEVAAKELELKEKGGIIKELAAEIKSTETAKNLYKLHADNVKMSMSGVSGHYLDFYVAKRLVATGHSEEQITEILMKSVPAFRPNTEHDFSSDYYAKTTARRAREKELSNPAPANMYRLWASQEKKIIEKEQQEQQKIAKKTHEIEL